MFIKYGIPLLASAGLGFAISTVSILTPQEQLGEASHPPPMTTLEGPIIAGLGEFQPAGAPVAVATPLSGIVSHVDVVADAKVATGDPLFRIDDRELLAALKSREGELATAKAKLAKLQLGTRPEEIATAEARVDAATVSARRTEDQFQRVSVLTSGSAISNEEFTSRRYAHDLAQAELRLFQTELTRLRAGTWRPDLAIAELEVETAQAEVDRILLDLERLTVRAPVAGTVLHVNVRVGEYADTGRTAVPLVQVGPDGPLHVRVQLAEEDIGCFTPVAQAEGFLRGQVRRRIPLKFLRIEPRVIPKASLTGAATERIDTRVLFVVYEVDGDLSNLYSGQKADVFIENLTKRDAR
ncbi:MAG: HlyD family secretion protein [Planctomycetota bacterium]